VGWEVLTWSQGEKEVASGWVSNRTPGQAPPGTHRQWKKGQNTSPWTLEIREVV
jgi:hypothetical protein